MITAALLALGGFALVCTTTVAVRWVDRCDCRWASVTHNPGRAYPPRPLPPPRAGWGDQR